MTTSDDTTTATGAPADRTESAFPVLPVASAEVLRQSVLRIGVAAETTVDELNAWVGRQAAVIARSDLGGDDDALFDYWDQVVETLGRGHVALPRAYREYTSGGAPSDHDRLDRLVLSVAAGVDPTVAVYWSPAARHCLVELSDVIDSEVPTGLPEDIDRVVTLLWWLWASVPAVHKPAVKAEADTVDTLGLVRNRWIQTCHDLIAMCRYE